MGHGRRSKTGSPTGAALLEGLSKIMSRPRVPFYKDDVKRAVAGVIAAGMKPGRVEIDGGKISVFAVDASAPTPRTSSISGRRSKMRVRLKGLNRVRVRLADGTV